MGNLGVPELLIILLIVLVFFGAKKIPEIASGVGKGIREFRKAARDAQEELEESPKTIADKTAPAVRDAARCVYCNSPVSGREKFCPTCGQSLEAPKCPKCGTVNALGSKFCVECGDRMPG